MGLKLVDAKLRRVLKKKFSSQKAAQHEGMPTFWAIAGKIRPEMDESCFYVASSTIHMQNPNLGKDCKSKIQIPNPKSTIQNSNSK